MNIFGRHFEEVGKASSDFLIITKGQVKVKWGNKFIDLIKDGKLNVEAQKIFNSVESKDNIDTGKDGIYITSNKEIYVVYDGNLIPIVQSPDDSEYVSYIEQNKTGQEKEVAQSNIGAISNTMNDAINSGIKNGIIYIIDELTLYLVKNGEFTPVKMDIPNPFTYPITIKLGSKSNYSLFIDGYFSDNGSGIIVGSEGNGLHVYCENDGTYIDASSKVDLRINGSNIITVLSSGISVNGNIDVVRGKYVQCDTIKTINGSKTNGTYIDKGEIYCDNIHVRNKITYGTILTYDDLRKLMKENGLKKGDTYYIEDYQNPWNIIDTIEEDIYDDSENDEENEDDDIDNLTPQKVKQYKNVFQLELTATSECFVSQNAKISDFPDVSILYDVMYDDVVARAIIDMDTYEVKAKGRIIYMEDTNGNCAPFDFINARFKINDKRLFAFGGDTDKSRNGLFRNCKILGDFNDFRFDSEDNEDGLSYKIGGDAMISMYNDSGFNDVTVKDLKGALIINSSNFKRNTISGFKRLDNQITNINFESSDSLFSLKEINSLSLTGKFNKFHIESDSASNINISNGANSYIKSNTINGLSINCESVKFLKIISDSINNLTISNNILRLYICSDINNVSIKGANNVNINGSLSNISFSEELKFCTFHSDLDSVDFSTIRNGYMLYNELKYADIYNNDGRNVVVCIPDLFSALFVGEVRMYHGDISDLPFGWHVCDGTNDTPNLTGKFIRAASSYGGTGGGEDFKMFIEKVNLPPHTHEAETTLDLDSVNIVSGQSQYVDTNDIGAIMANFSAANNIQSDLSVRLGVFDEGGSKNFAVYAGYRGNEYGYQIKSIYNLVKEMKLSVSGNGNANTVIEDTISYKQEEITIPNNKVLPPYYDMIFIMYTGK